MARPKKNGLSYFPRDTDIHGDRKIRRLLYEHGSQGFLIFDYLLCLIYRDNGYWIAYDDEICFDVADYLKCDITEEKVKEVVSSCVKLNLFDETLYQESKILTSSGIQKRFISAKRTGVIDAELIVTAVKTSVSAVKTPDFDAESTQSKVKYSKVNKSKVKESKEEGGETSSPAHSQDDIDKFKNFNDWLRVNAPRVLQMKQPFTISEYIKVRDALHRDKMTDLLKKMHNHKPLLSKNISAYLTLLNWAGHDWNNTQGQGQNKESSSGGFMKKL